MIQPNTYKQLKAIFALAKSRDFGDEDLRSLAADVSAGRVERLSLLSFDEANRMIVHLGGEAMFSSRTPRRTINFHRQQAGVKQIAQASHLDLMYTLAANRGMTITGLASLAERIIKHFPPRTTADTNKVIEGLKAMNARDRKVRTTSRERVGSSKEAA